MSSPRPWMLHDINYAAVKQRKFEVAVLPLGATEPHNLHLPYGTDTIEAVEIASRACQWAYERGAGVIQLPAIPYGTETNMFEFPLAMNVMPSTLGLLIADLVRSLEKHGIRKCLLLNSHGGNEFKPLLRELAVQTSVKLFLCDWFRGLSADVAPQIFTHKEDHAGEVETSLIMELAPELVATDPVTGRPVADEGSVRSTRFEAVNKGWVSLSRPWHLLTTNTGSGNPLEATPEKGRKLLEILTQRLGDFLVELAAAPLDKTFPF